jgi:hypothetical protein
MVIRIFGSQQHRQGYSVYLPWNGILMLVLLPLLHDYLNGCMRARSLGIMAQIKKWKNHYWYLQVYGLISMPLFFG